MIHRIDVRTAAPARASNDAAGDPLGQSIRQQIIEFGHDVGPVSTARIFLIDAGDSNAPEQMRRAARELLADPIVEEAHTIEPDHLPRDQGSRIEIHLKPGVMDPVAASTEMAL